MIDCDVIGFSGVSNDKGTVTERGSVAGTVSVFLDISFGVAPVALGLVANRAGYEPTFIISAVLAVAGAGLLILRRRSLVLSVSAR